MMIPTSQLYLGTSGWSYPTGYGKWSGLFYPRRGASDELAYYAERFSAVEVNASFYRLPAPATVRGWAERTPAPFRFTMKLFRKFTHPDFYAREEGQSPEITPADVAAMRAALDPLAERGKLGALLVQYPEFFTRSEHAVAGLVRTLDAFHDYPLAVELRHRSWLASQTRDVLAHFRAALVRIDEPFFQTLDIPAAPAETLQYWRFHGRNAAEWRARGAGAKRYDYLYAPEEIDELAEIIERHRNPGQTAFVFCNNHPNAQAIANSIELAARLGLPIPFKKFAHLTAAFPRLAPLTGDGKTQMEL